MKKYILLSTLLWAAMFFSQRTDCYIPDGNKCPKNKNVGKNMDQLNFKFEPKGRTWFMFPKDGDAFIVFKAFTREPLYVLTNKKESSTPDEIKALIADADFSQYKVKFISTLKKYIDKKNLTDSFLLETIGSPDDSGERYQNGRSVKYMHYKQLGIRIYLNNSVAYAYDEI